MPILFKAIAVFLATVTSALVARVLASAGIGLLIYTGVEASIDLLRDRVISQFGQIGDSIASLMGLFGIDVYISLVLSAYAAVVASRIIGGALVRMGFLARLVDQVKGGS